MTDNQDSLDFFAKYKDWKSANSLSVQQNTNPKEVARYLASVRESIDKKAFEVLGIKLGILDSYSENITKGMPKGPSQLVVAYQKIGSKDSEVEIGRATSNNDQVKPFAKAYLFRRILENLGIEFYMPRSSKLFSSLGKSKEGQAPNAQSEMIYFMAKYKEWISIKKMNIRENTKPEEVSAHLSSIRATVDRKEAEFIGIDVFTLDSYAAGLTENLRKSVANLQKMLDAINSAEGKKQIEAACQGDLVLRDAAQAYLLKTLLQSIKFDYDVNPQTLMDMFPGLKIPKPKGRMPGQKKKPK